MKNYKEMRQQVREYRAVANLAKGIFEKTVAECKELYKEPLLTEKVEIAQQEYNERTIIGKRLLVNDIESFRDAKTEQLEKSVAKSPTAEQSAKLTQLATRKSLAADEIEIVAKSMSDNYGAMRSLSDIAESNGQYFNVPDYIEIRDNLNWACDYALKMLDNPSEYQELEFCGDYSGITWDMVTEPLDTDIFITIPKVERRTLTDNEAELLHTLFGDTPTNTLAFEVNKAAKSPEIKKLIELSPDYGALLED